ncbi:MAG: hypothetical protein IKK43_03590 [Clostridia bacterium]|nr:hypothetical protein [Clostridia bacterium]
MKINNNKGVSMITVIITIIVVIILAAISLIGNEDAINKSAEAKKEAEIAQETQILKIALKDAENIFTGEVEKEELALGLEDHSAIIDESYVSENPDKGEYKIVFNKTGNSYIIDKYGAITVLDRIYAEGDTPSSPSTPSNPDEPAEPDEPETPSGGGVNNYITISGTNYFLIGDIATMEFEKNPTNLNEYKGLNIVRGDVIGYNGEYYIVRENGYVHNNNRGSIITNKQAIKINLDKGITTPSSASVAGDIKSVNGIIYVFDPNPWYNDPTDWSNETRWIKVNEETSCFFS